MKYKALVAKYLAETLNLDAQMVEGNLETPPQEDMGDFALPCFRMAKELRKAPQKIAEDFANQLTELPEYISDIKNAGAYVNVFLNRALYCQDFVGEALAIGEQFAHTGIGEGKTILVEYSSPNIAKPFHVGHAFSTIIGDVLAKMYQHQGYNVVRLNHLGDYGTQFGKLIVAYELWGDEEKLTSDPIGELLRIYVRFHKEAELRPELDLEARARFKALEEGGANEYRLWQRFRDLSLKEFESVYKRLGVHFDSYNGESFYSDKIPAVVKELEEKGLLETSEGARVVKLDELDLPPCIVLKSDGSTIYATRDLAAAAYRYETYNFDNCIYVVGLPQNLHFKQVFAVLAKAGHNWAKNLVHVGFGLVKFPGDRKFSTRSGDVIYLEDLLNEAVSKTREIIVANNNGREVPMSEEEINETAEAIGLGAVRYTFIRSGRERDIVFEWEDILDFEGDSAPYMQYAFARAHSILRRSGVTPEEAMQLSPAGLGSDSEFALCREMAQLNIALQQATDNNEPSILARQVMTVCRAFSRFYNQMPILQADNIQQREARLALCAAFVSVLQTTLGILGIRTVERM